MTAGTALAIASGAVAAAGYPPVLYQGIRGTYPPERLSWLIWTAEYVLLAGAAWKARQWPVIWVVGAGLAGCSLVWLVSLWHGQPAGRGKGERAARIVTLAGCAAALAAWRWTRDPVTAFWLLVGVEVAATIWTARKAYRLPATEPGYYWWLLVASGLLAAVAVLFTPGRPALSYGYAAQLTLGALLVLAAKGAGTEPDIRDYLRAAARQ